MGDFLKIGGHVSGMGYDGSSETWLTLELPFKTPILLQSEYEDIAEIYINDNLSGLTNFSCVARGYVEYKIDSDIGMKNVY